MDLQAGTPKPLWVRLVALWCVLASIGLGWAQAGHTHGRLRPHERPHVAVLDSNDLVGDLCPLCTALHFCTPPEQGRALYHLPPVPLEASATPLVAPARPLPFVLSSRPPPALLTVCT